MYAVRSSSALNTLSVLRILVAPFTFGPNWLRRAIVDATPLASVQYMKNIVDTMHARSCEIVAEKRAALARGDDAVKRQVGEGKDIMSILRE